MESYSNVSVPATEENLRLEIDPSIMDVTDDGNPPESSPLHSVLVDGIRGVAGIGYFGTWSQRIHLILEREHQTLGSNFMTKYFRFTRPGVVSWGFDDQSFTIVKTLE